MPRRSDSEGASPASETSDVPATKDAAQTSLSIRARLNFSYEFESEDGTHIELTAQAKLRISSRGQEEDALQVRQKVQLHVSLIQESVADGVAPEGEAGAVGNSGIAEGLQAFQDLLAGLTQQFLDTGEIDGDELITGIVEGFNKLVDALSSIINPQQALEAENVPSLPYDPPPVDVAPEVVADGPVALVQEPPALEGIEADEVAPPATGESPVIASTQQLFVHLRLRFTQSLSGLVGALEQSTRLDLRAYVRYASASQPQPPALDVRA